MHNDVKYHYEIDYLRGFAIISLIIVHVLSYCLFIDKLNSIIIVSMPIIIFSRFVVPAFIFISGFILYLKYKSKTNIKEFYLKRFLKIIPPYVIFSLLYYLWNNFVNDKSGFSIADLTYQVLTANAHAHFWFFALIIQIYLLFPFVLYIYRRIKRKSLFVLIIFIIQIAWTAVYPEINDKLNCNKCNIFNVILSDIIFNRRFFLSHIAYFIFGFYFYENIYYLTKHFISVILTFMVIITIIINTLLWIKGFNIYNNFSDIPASFLMPIRLINIVLFTSTIVLLYKIALKASNEYENHILIKTFHRYGNHSYCIYLIHAGIIQGISIILVKLGSYYDNILFYILLIVIATPLSYWVSMFISKLPYSEYIVGKRSTK
jgi:peptidoglycan/LPS O-acetylase OafA/YrhL